MKTKSILLGGLMCLMVFIMTACSGSVEDSEDAMLTLDFGYSMISGLTYEIDITDSDGQTVFSDIVYNADPITIKVAVGEYTIHIIAYSNYMTKIKYAEIVAVIEVKPGPNPTPITLTKIGAVAAPIATPGTGGTYNNPQTVTLSCTTSGAAIYYTMTTNGSEPGVPSKSSTLYGSAIPINTSGVVKIRARAFKDGMEDSAIMPTATYNMNATWTASTNSSTSNTTTITFTFNLFVNGLVANEITIPGVTKGALTPDTSTGSSSTGYTKWTLAVSPTVGGANNRTISFSKTGVVGTGSPSSVTIYGGFPLWAAVVSSTFPASSIYGIAYGNNKFIAVGELGRMAYSTDAATWTAGGYNTFTADIRGIVYGNNRFVAVGQEVIIDGGNVSSNGKMFYSSDGINWTAVANSTFGSSIINGIAWANNKFVAVGDDGKIAYSLTE